MLPFSLKCPDILFSNQKKYAVRPKILFRPSYETSKNTQKKKLVHLIPIFGHLFLSVFPNILPTFFLTLAFWEPNIILLMLL